MIVCLFSNLVVDVALALQDCVNIGLLLLVE